MATAKSNHLPDLALWFAQNRSSRYRAEVRRVLTLLLPKF